MKITGTIARYLLGLIFTVFGLNGFLNFLKQPPPVDPLAVHFFTAVIGSHYAHMFFAFQFIAGLLLLSGFFVPLALIVLAGELVNILTFHATMAPDGFAPGLVATALWILVFLQYRSSFTPLLRPKPENL
jgi:uncharacterized membrane protein YphA (DoxX/SURF4 family)